MSFGYFSAETSCSSLFLLFYYYINILYKSQRVSPYIDIEIMYHMESKNIRRFLSGVIDKCFF